MRTGSWGRKAATGQPPENPQPEITPPPESPKLEVDQEIETKEAEFDKILHEAESQDIQTNLVTGTVKETKITKQTVVRIIDMIAYNTGLQHKYVLQLVFILFLKGAANFGAPLKLTAELETPEGKISLQKKELMYAYETVTKNPYLRRMAEFLATNISHFAEKNKINGDLFNKINLLITTKDEPLTQQERAWCSSFNQKNPDCLEKHQRVYTLLSVEYNLKFGKSNIKRNNPPRAQKKK